MLEGKKGPFRDVAVLNAAAALVVAGKARTASLAASSTAARRAASTAISVRSKCASTRARRAAGGTPACEARLIAWSRFRYDESTCHGRHPQQHRSL